jgi:signal peptidase I
MVKNGWVVVNGLKLNEPYKRRKLDPPYPIPKVTVPAGHFYVLGDNRENSTDSRTHGPLPGGNILGKASFILWPAGRWGLIPSFRGKRFLGT